MRIGRTDTVVIKVGTSTLTYSNGKINLRLIENLCKTVSDLQNAGKKVILVSSGAIGVGVGKLGLRGRPEETAKKQALAAVGQCELMFLYDKFFSEYSRTVAQVLLTAEDVHDDRRRKNVQNTFHELLSMDIIPVVNENDTVATAELEGHNFGDNDTLSAIVATLTGADVLVILTDIDGMYNGNPQDNPEAMRIPLVREIDNRIRSLAGGVGSSRGTGGMATKVRAAEIATGCGIATAIISGDNPANLYKLFAGEDIGTVFLPR